MKALLVGGSGTISSAVTRLLLSTGWEVTLLNRGLKQPDQSAAPGAQHITADINDEDGVAAKLAGLSFDVVANFVAFSPEQVARDVRLFSGRTRQYVFVSSASAYEKPPRSPFITESTPLANPFWQYSRDKAACEEVLFRAHRESGFPVTVVRPSHTYGDGSVPVMVHGGKCGSWQVVQRIQQGKPVLVCGDGSSLWTLTDARDFAKGFVGLMGNEGAIGEAVHITSDESLTWNQIYEAIASAVGGTFVPCYVPARMLAACKAYDYSGMVGDKANSVVFDNSKVKRLVPGFSCSVRFEDGVKNTLRYVMGHPECQTPDPAFDSFCDRVASIMDNALQSINA